MTDPAVPTLMSEVEVSSLAEKVVVRQQEAYVAHSDGTLSIYDVSDVTNIDAIDKRLVNSGSDLLVSDDGSVLIAVGDSSDGNIYIVDTTTSWTRVGETPRVVVVTANADGATNASSIDLDDTTGIEAGMSVAGVGIPFDTTVLSIDSSTQITLSAAVTLSPDEQLKFAEAAATTFTAENLIKGVPQYFRVAAVNPRGQGAWSEYSSLVVPEGVPDAPLNFTATINQIDGSVDLAWEAPLYDGGEEITSYTISYQELGSNAVEVNNLDSAALAYNLPSLTYGKTYIFKVKAHNAYGGEDWSTEVTLNTPNVPQIAPAIPGYRGC